MHTHTPFGASPINTCKVHACIQEQHFNTRDQNYMHINNVYMHYAFYYDIVRLSVGWWNWIAPLQSLHKLQTQLIALKHMLQYINGYYSYKLYNTAYEFSRVRRCIATVYMYI